MRARVLGPALGALIAVCLLPAPAARAYVRTLTEAGAAMAWQHSCITLVLYAGDPPRDLDRATLITGVRAAASAWSADTQPRTSLTLNVEVANEASAGVGIDYVNRISFRRSKWGKEPCDPLREKCSYDSSVIALTSVFSVKSDGRILDSDMEINAVDYKWADVLATGRQNERAVHDVQNVLTHELGHLIGLDHTCFNPLSDPQRMRDQNRQPVPDCKSAPDSVRSTTMFASAESGAIDKRDLEADDVAALVEIYPRGGIPCAEEDQGGCTVVRATPGRAPLLPAGAVLVGLGLVLWRWRRRRGKRAG